MLETYLWMHPWWENIGVGGNKLNCCFTPNGLELCHLVTRSVNGVPVCSLGAPTGYRFKYIGCLQKLMRGEHTLPLWTHRRTSEWILKHDRNAHALVFLKTNLLSKKLTNLAWPVLQRSKRCYGHKWKSPRVFSGYHGFHSNSTLCCLHIFYQFIHRSLHKGEFHVLFLVSERGV